ncbi:hypothetical protein MGH68_08510 [Erysipelothrix sp. D19-032]
MPLPRGISPYAVTVPMGLAGNLLRAVSPVSLSLLSLLERSNKIHSKL